MGCWVSSWPNCCEEENALQFSRCTVIPIFRAKQKKKEYKNHNLKTLSKEYIIHEGKIQEVQNRLQYIHDNN
jgi:hypothetical protein